MGMDDNDLSYEPMDIDLSSQSANAMDISYNESNIESEIRPDTDGTESHLDFKPGIVNELYAHTKQNRIQNPTNNKNKSGLLISGILLIISVIVIQIVNFKCSTDLNIDLISESLTRKVYGQSLATNIIIKALKAKEKRKILAFYGGTGVGKTYTSSIILQNVVECNNIYHYTMPGILQNFSSELMLGLLFCNSATVVIDDLKVGDVLKIKDILKELIMKSWKLAKNITIILIYNCDIVENNLMRKCDNSFLPDLNRSLLDLDAVKYFIKFEPLTEAHLKKCIENELLDRTLSVADFIKIVKNFDVSLDGCKGVHKRIKYLKIV